MRIQLIHPPSHMAHGNIQTSRPTQPLGLAYVAGALRKAGHELVVLDAIAEAPTQQTPVGNMTRLGLVDEQILDRIDPQARALAITNMFSFNWPALRTLIGAIRARHPDKIIVCGGEHFSGLPILSMEQAPIDYIVVGEGEEVATELFAGLDAGDSFDPATVRGIVWRHGDEIVQNPRAERARAIDDIAWPAWDLFDVDRYNAYDLVGGLRLGKTIPILATRGCPYQCTYCSSPQMWTTRWYARDPVDVADEIEFYARRFGAENFPFQDLTAIVRKDWIVRFCNEVIRRNLNIRWQLPSGTRCEVVDDEVAPLLWRSGCRWVCYAPESGSERTRELIKKRMKTSSLMKAVDAAVAAGLHLELFIVIGFPHDTADDLRQTSRLLRTLARKGVEDVGINFFFPIPSTELFTYLTEKGRIGLTDDVLMAPLYGLHMRLSEDLNFCEHLPAGKLTWWKYRLWANFYLTSYASHPGRVLRVAYNALRGRETSAMEKLLLQTGRKVLRRVRRPSGDAAVAARA